MKIQKHLRTLALIVCFHSSIHISHAGSLLWNGDDAVLVPPVANFRTELNRLKPPAEFASASTGYESTATNFIVEADDLKAALQSAGKSTNDIDRIVSAHLAERYKLQQYDDDLEKSRESEIWVFDENGEGHSAPPPPAPAFPTIKYTDGLPAEFADYLEGTLAWHNPKFSKSVARAAWERILSRPPNERRYKSTWAAFMLGRSWEKADPSKAIQYFEQVRTFAPAGFSDSLGLASTSLGQEARVYLERKDYVHALDLYMRQLGTGEWGAEESVMFVMRDVFLNGTAAFPTLATNAQSRRIVTAYIVSTKALQVSQACGYPEDEESSNHLHQVVHTWLTTAEEAAAHDPVEMREEMALAAYQNGDWQLAQRWVDRAGGSPVAQWLQAKLLFQAKRTSDAGGLLAGLEPLFPLQRADTNAPLELKDNLECSSIAAPQQVWAEVGVYYVSRGLYAEALTHFLQAGFWPDAAYVAERLLTTDELKSYVNHYDPVDPDEFKLNYQRLSHLLARRLTRELRGDEAHDYYPLAYQEEFEQLAKALTEGWNESGAPDERATALFTAAKLVRENGMELLGTEMAPDGFSSGGSYEPEQTAEARTNETFTILPATADELRRYSESAPDPNKRYHYKYQAAALAWEAAKLMPDNSDDTALVLCTAGSWIKYLDAETADLFYKALVRRCGKTELGHEADVRRWFPKLDDDGNIIPRGLPEPLAVAPDCEEEQPQPDVNDSVQSDVVDQPSAASNVYEIQRGDTLARIAKQYGLTLKAIIDANPELALQHIKVGQQINIPPAASE